MWYKNGKKRLTFVFFRARDHWMRVCCAQLVGEPSNKLRCFSKTRLLHADTARHFPATVWWQGTNSYHVLWRIGISFRHPVLTESNKQLNCQQPIPILHVLWPPTTTRSISYRQHASNCSVTSHLCQVVFLHSSLFTSNGSKNSKLNRQIDRQTKTNCVTQ